jgi:hypothetical protein
MQFRAVLWECYEAESNTRCLEILAVLPGAANYKSFVLRRRLNGQAGRADIGFE